MDSPARARRGVAVRIATAALASTIGLLVAAPGSAIAQDGPGEPPSATVQVPPTDTGTPPVPEPPLVESPVEEAPPVDPVPPEDSQPPDESDPPEEDAPPDDSPPSDGTRTGEGDPPADGPAEAAPEGRDSEDVATTTSVRPDRESALDRKPPRAANELYVRPKPAEESTFADNPCRAAPGSADCREFLYPYACSQSDSPDCDRLTNVNPCAQQPGAGTGPGSYGCRVFLETVCRASPYGGPCNVLLHAPTLGYFPGLTGDNPCRVDPRAVDCTFAVEWLCEMVGFAPGSLDCGWYSRLLSVRKETFVPCLTALETGAAAPSPWCHRYGTAWIAQYYYTCTLRVPALACYVNFGAGQEETGVPSGGGRTGGDMTHDGSPAGGGPGGVPTGPGRAGGASPRLVVSRADRARARADRRRARRRLAHTGYDPGPTALVGLLALGFGLLLRRRVRAHGEAAL